MISLRHVTFRYPGATTAALQDVSVDIKDGAFALVTGASGSGKSTLVRCLNGLVPHFSGGYLSGMIRVNGCDPVIETPQVMSRQVGFVFQEPETQFVVDVVEDELAFSLENAAVEEVDMHRRVDWALAALDLLPLRRRRIDTLSGGQAQRVAIASALIFQPGILVLDEPTSQLDPHSAEEVLNSLAHLRQQLGLTIVLVEHRLERVLPYCDLFIYLCAGQPGVKSGPPRQVLETLDLEHPPVVSLSRRMGWRPLPLTVNEAEPFCQQLVLPGKMTPQPAMQRDPPVVQAENVSIRYGDLLALDGVSLSLQPGELAILMGANGSGKTTLLRCLVGLLHPGNGQVSLMGKDTKGKDVAEICQQVGYLPQDPNSLLFAETVADELRATLKNHHLPAGVDSIQVLLEQLGIISKSMAYPRDLSVGERQRVALGAVMVTRPAVLLLDEPTRGLDYRAKVSLGTLLSYWRDQGTAILVATHDVEFTAMFAGRVILLEAGQIIADGLPFDVFSARGAIQPQIMRLFPGTGWLNFDDAAQNLTAQP